MSISSKFIFCFLCFQLCFVLLLFFFFQHLFLFKPSLLYVLLFICPVKRVLFLGTNSHCLKILQLFLFLFLQLFLASLVSFFNPCLGFWISKLMWVFISLLDSFFSKLSIVLSHLWSAFSLLFVLISFLLIIWISCNFSFFNLGFKCFIWFTFNHRLFFNVLSVIGYFLFNCHHKIVLFEAQCCNQENR